MRDLHSVRLTFTVCRALPELDAVQVRAGIDGFNPDVGASQPVAAGDVEDAVRGALWRIAPELTRMAMAALEMDKQLYDPR